MGHRPTLAPRDDSVAVAGECLHGTSGGVAVQTRDVPEATEGTRAELWMWLSLVLVIVFGVLLRQWIWLHTPTIRYPRDLNNAFQWGMTVNRPAPGGGNPTWRQFIGGLRGIYDQEKALSSGKEFRLDYAPGRLLVMSLWARGVNARHPAVPGWTWDDVTPLLWLNTAAAAAAAAGARALVHYWVGRHEQRAGEAGGSWRPWVCGWSAAALLWLNPAVLADAHVWPQWDIWCMPFFLWAAYAASVGRWSLAGGLVLLGAMFKGQILLVAPALVVWSAFSGVRPAIELAAGFLAAAAVCCCMWLVPSAPAWAWVLVALSAGCLSWATRHSGKWAILIVSTSAFGLGLAVKAGHGIALSCAIVSAVWLLILAPQLAIVRRLGVGRSLFASALVAASIWSACALFGGSVAWARIAFLQPTDAQMSMSLGATNLPSLLHARWHWRLEDTVLGRPGGSHHVTLRSGLRLIYVACIVLCGVAAHVQARREGARVLVALTAPWVLAFTLLPQMHERYLIWAAVVSAVGVGVSANLAVCHLAVTCLSLVDILKCLLPLDATFARSTSRFYSGIAPYASWLLILVALAYVYQSFKSDSAARRAIAA